MLNLDTHMVVAVLDGSLSDKELPVILGNELAISDIVFWELAKLIELDRLRLDLSSKEFLKLRRHLTVVPINPEIAQTSTQLDFSSDPADEIIAATSVVEDVPLLTRDRKILKSHMVPFA